jgi:hypothetical protein
MPSFQRWLKCTQQPPGVSGESMTPHPCSRWHTRTVPTECTSKLYWEAVALVCLVYRELGRFSSCLTVGLASSESLGASLDLFLFV